MMKRLFLLAIISGLFALFPLNSHALDLDSVPKCTFFDYQGDPIDLLRADPRFDEQKTGYIIFKRDWGGAPFNGNPVLLVVWDSTDVRFLPDGSLDPSQPNHFIAFGTPNLIYGGDKPLAGFGRNFEEYYMNLAGQLVFVGSKSSYSGYDLNCLHSAKNYFHVEIDESLSAVAYHDHRSTASKPKVFPFPAVDLKGRDGTFFLDPRFSVSSDLPEFKNNFAYGGSGFKPVFEVYDAQQPTSPPLFSLVGDSLLSEIDYTFPFDGDFKVVTRIKMSDDPPFIGGFLDVMPDHFDTFEVGKSEIVFRVEHSKDRAIIPASANDCPDGVCDQNIYDLGLKNCDLEEGNLEKAICHVDNYLTSLKNWFINLFVPKLYYVKLAFDDLRAKFSEKFSLFFVVPDFFTSLRNSVQGANYDSFCASPPTLNFQFFGSQSLNFSPCTPILASFRGKAGFVLLQILVNGLLAISLVRLLFRYFKELTSQ